MLSVPLRPVLPTLVAVVAVVALAGCSSDPEPQGAPSDASSSQAAAPTSTATSAPPEPATPTTHSDAELLAAMPDTPAELHGLPESDSCLTFARPCSAEGDDGFAYVSGSRSSDDIAVNVSITRRYDGAQWRQVLARCPQGPYETALRTTGADSYVPGERGTSRRTPFVIGTWSGFTCRKDFVRLFPDGEESERVVEHVGGLHNGRHVLLSLGRTRAEVELLATEYLARLEDRTP
ncbi:MAG: hypothetical protein JWN84_2005 [Nocardioides sp.]|nr:hypothetical protein [Nocardioides sp.]